MTNFLRFQCLLLCLTSSFFLTSEPSVAHAEGADHLQCYRVRDGIDGSYRATLTTSGEGFTTLEGCVVKLKAKQVCRPVSSAIESSDVPGDLLDGDPDEFYRVCYRAKCPKETIGDVAVSDRFAGRPFSKWKTSLICAPALRGELYDVTFRLNSPESLLGLQVDVTYDASDIGFEGQGASVSCDTMVTDPDAVALLDDEEAGRLSAMVIEGDTVSGPMDVFTCRVAAMSAPTSSDFTVVAEGVEPDATPTAPSVTISSIVPVE